MSVPKQFEWCGYNWKCTMEGGRRVNPGRPWEWFSEDAVKINDDNSVTLDIFKSPKDIKHWDGKTYHCEYATGIIRTIDEFGYGTFSAEIMLPKGKNLWPAFWTVGVGRWPDNGEFDICEAWTNEKGSYFRATIPQFPYLVPGWKTTNNVHYLKDGEHCSTGTRNVPWIKQPKNPSENYIKYEVEWTPEKIIFKANGHTIRSYGKSVANMLKGKKMNIIFNIWTDAENFTCESPMIIKNFEYKECSNFYGTDIPVGRKHTEKWGIKYLMGQIKPKM